MTKKYWPMWKDVLPPGDTKWTPCVRGSDGLSWEDALEMLILEIKNDARTEGTHPLRLAVAMVVTGEGFVPGQIVALSDYEYTILEERPL